MVDGSTLKAVVARLEEALREAREGNQLPFGTARVQRADITILFETIKRYGGRRDWTPTEENLAELPSPVLRYIVQQRREIAELQRKLLDVSAMVRKMEKFAARIRNPPR
jgi:hypothetical protein